MIYLYVTPSGSVNLIEGDKMPDKKDYVEGFIQKYFEHKAYETDLAAVKASSTPCSDQERAKKYLKAYVYSRLDIDEPTPQTDTIYGPFDIGYRRERKKCEGCGVSDDADCKKSPGHCEYMLEDVAILLPEKEPVKQDAKSDQEIEDAATLYANVHYGDRGKITYPEAIAVWECGLEDFIAGAKWAKVEPVGKLEEKEESGVSKLKIALLDKIKQFEAYKTDPNYQTEMEQNAVIVILRELKYLDSIVEYE